MMTTSAAKKKAAEKAADHGVDPDAPIEDGEEPDGPHVVTEVTWNGMTAFDTIDGVQGEARPATLAEQLTKHADEILRLVVGSVPYATSGSLELDGTTLTINLVSH
jgi:hypothetical protein